MNVNHFDISETNPGDAELRRCHFPVRGLGDCSAYLFVIYNIGNTHAHMYICVRAYFQIQQNICQPINSGNN